MNEEQRADFKLVLEYAAMGACHNYDEEAMAAVERIEKWVANKKGTKT